MLLSVLGPKVTGILAGSLPVNGLLDAASGGATKGDSTWSIGNFLNNATETLKVWGNYLILLIGVVLIVWSAVQIARGLISHGKTQISWPVNIIMLLVGGAFLVGGFNLLSKLSSGGQATIIELGEGTKKSGAAIVMLQNVVSMLGL